MQAWPREYVVLMLAVTAMALTSGGCGGKGAASGGDDISVLVNSDSPQDRLAASKRLAAQGESVIPAILEAFGKTEGKAEAQMALADAVFRMKTSAAQVEALEKMAGQTKDKSVSERVLGLARQRKVMH